MARIRTQTDTLVEETPYVTDRRLRVRDGKVEGTVELSLMGVDITFRVSPTDLAVAKELRDSTQQVVDKLERGLRGEQ